MTSTVSPSSVGADNGKWVKSPTQFRRKGLWQVIKRTANRVMDTDVSLRCSGVAFYGFLSIFPAIAAGVALYALVADPATLREHLSVLSGFLPAEAVAIIDEQVSALSAETKALGVGLAVSILLAIWSGSRGVNAL
ncbi:MAG: YhjD/YihY/BrkB family envelope integrity protein, partial [Pseudomonadota bacterium]